MEGPVLPVTAESNTQALRNWFKFVAIAVATDSDNAEALYALGNDGKVYLKTMMRHSQGSIYNGRKVKHTFYSPEFWQELDLEFAEAAQPTATLETLLEPEAPND